MSGKPCGICGQVRKILPNKVAAYLLDLELKRQAAKKRPALSLRYTTTTQPAATAAPSPGHLPAIPPAGEGGAG
ncbi:MAG TPA: hypothetical protein VGL34_25115 [Steroidobacteraceae bacterium]|jgi:hypothetical protein